MATIPKQEQMNSSHGARAPGGEPTRSDPRTVAGAGDDNPVVPDEPTETADSTVQKQTERPEDRGRGVPKDATLDMDEELDEDDEDESPTTAL